MHEDDIFDSCGCMIHYGGDGNQSSFPKDSVRLIACGDTGPVRKLESIVIQKGASYVLGQLKDRLAGADLVVANLECTFSDRGVPLDRVPVFRISPEAFSIVTESHITVVSLANNHMFDYGPDAFQDTVNLLREHNIGHFGGGLSKEEASEPYVVEINNVRLGFLGFRNVEPRWHNDNNVYTEQMVPGIIKQRINRLRSMVDWLVVSLHFGYEYQHFPSPRDVKLCRELIDCGADIILGHHPHYPQGVETYNNGIIAYSLGNFIWDQNFVGHTASSFLLEIQLSKTRIVSMEAVPFTLDKTYRLQYNYSAIDEINELSKVVINKRKHEREWYFIARNKLVEFARILKSTIIKDGFTAENIYKFCSNRFSPRFIYVAKSFLFFVLTGKAIYYEISKLVLKLIK